LFNEVSIMKETKFSIIIPSFNQGQFIERTILSILDQSYTNYEVIIIDGGSTDNTIDILHKYDSKIKYWVSEKDNGQSHAFNKGLGNASGDFIGWINSDDIYFPGAFQSVNDRLLLDPEIDILFGDYSYIDEHDKTIHRKREICYNYLEAFWTGKCYHANLAGFFRRNCFIQIGSMDVNLHYAMDYDLYLRLGLANCKFDHIRRPLGAYRIHGNSKTTLSYHKMAHEVGLVQEKYRGSIPGIMHPGLLRLYYASIRKIKKVMQGCYSVKNILSIWNLHAKLNSGFSGHTVLNLF